MKNLMVAIAVFFVANTASASCYQQVAARLEKSLEKKGHSYHGIERKLGHQVVKIMRESEVLSDRSKSEIGSLLQSGRFEMYLLTASQGPGGYQELLAVSKQTCATYRRYETYTE